MADNSPILPKQATWPKIIEAVGNKPLSLLALIVLALGTVVMACVPLVQPVDKVKIVLIGGILFAFVALCALVEIIGNQTRVRSDGNFGAKKMPDQDQLRTDQEKKLWLQDNQSLVWQADNPPLSPDDQTEQLKQLRSVIYQAPQYSTPTYFLDPHLAVIHWNVAFEVIFEAILPKIRRNHVNYFIVELANRADVFDHAREFTQKVKDGALPLVDMEALTYESAKYGTIEFVKIATQLTDSDANLKAWSVSLLLKRIDWTLYLDEIERRLRDDRLWGSYAVSYDAVLSGFEPYEDLIKDVIGGIRANANRVLELGAGTGNVTRQLLKRGCTVTVVENNTFMLDKMATKGLRSTGKLTVVVESVENTEFGGERNFDAAVAVNVVYALDDPARCFRKVAAVLKKGGVFALSTTHSETKLNRLLGAIKDDLIAKGEFKAKEEHYNRVLAVNEAIEGTLATRYTLEQYRAWLMDAGFEIIHSEARYFDAVEVIHARKV
jgi:SAM-dependent methyltransferase